jgi:hypothetical protein
MSDTWKLIKAIAFLVMSAFLIIAGFMLMFNLNPKAIEELGLVRMGAGAGFIAIASHWLKEI